MEFFESFKRALKSKLSGKLESFLGKKETIYSFSRFYDAHEDDLQTVMAFLVVKANYENSSKEYLEGYKSAMVHISELFNECRAAHQDDALIEKGLQPSRNE